MRPPRAGRSLSPDRRRLVDGFVRRRAAVADDFRVNVLKEGIGHAADYIPIAGDIKAERR
jgi:hypothetical protein